MLCSGEGTPLGWNRLLVVVVAAGRAVPVWPTLTTLAIYDISSFFFHA